MEHEKLLEEAWAAPGNTIADLPAVDVNQVLADRYDVDRDLVFTRSMLWDMEVRKASAPDIYIPTVVRPGSREKFDGKTEGRTEEFTRVSDQRLWLDQDTYGTVIEHVHLDHDQQRAFFIGASEFTTPDGRVLHAGTGQPLFHVEHSVAGTELRPLNRWRIVNLTETVDKDLAEYFAGLARDEYLRVFIEVYLRQDLGYQLTRK
ncbi:MAG: hypothetical protein JWQ81_7230 [Amycolatopsis sp.]|uniref:hypothetical protein n=1 Tax=Amycolatopsis sp. TaxID=37632 RepID=UPI002628B7CC|nr:hypothetical protein [Amycolatopsis sp.]MCU1686491.1 hypothetical protein [Amycolatopsis sp.]